jgi:hypothetical protein
VHSTDAVATVVHLWIFEQKRGNVFAGKKGGRSKAGFSLSGPLRWSAKEEPERQLGLGVSPGFATRGIPMETVPQGQDGGDKPQQKSLGMTAVVAVLGTLTAALGLARSLVDLIKR